MIAIIELVVFGFIGLSVMFLVVNIYSRSVRREKLEKQYDAGGGAGERDAFVAQGMAEYDHGLRKRLIWLVYVIPALVVAGTVYLVNHQ